MARSIIVRCMVVICMLVLGGSPRAVEGAVTCGGVTKTLTPCMQYLKGSGGAPPANCCGGVRTLKAMAQTPADRKTACTCMKAAAAKLKGLNYGAANRLAGQCGVRISYTFSPNTNCNIVQ